jgi:hypothetical protein
MGFERRGLLNLFIGQLPDANAHPNCVSGAVPICLTSAPRGYVCKPWMNCDCSTTMLQHGGMEVTSRVTKVIAVVACSWHWMETPDERHLYIFRDTGRAGASWPSFASLERRFRGVERAHNMFEVCHRTFQGAKGLGAKAARSASSPRNSLGGRHALQFRRKGGASKTSTWSPSSTKTACQLLAADSRPDCRLGVRTPPPKR